MIVRAKRYLPDHELAVRIMLFVDDGKALVPIEHFCKALPAILALYVALGFDVKYTNIRGGATSHWIDHWLCRRSYKLGTSAERQAWVVKWISDLLVNKEVTSGFDSGLGRLSFVCSAVVFDRSVLAPLYSHAAMVRKRTGRKASCFGLPPSVRFTLDLLRSRLEARGLIHCSAGRTAAGLAVERCRTDAKAEGDIVTIGEYQSFDGFGCPIAHKNTVWLLLSLNRSNAPWPFQNGEPFPTTASLELLGTLMGLLLLLDGNEDPSRRSSAHIYP